MLRAPAIWLAAALSGAAALAYEIAWSRALVVPLGNSTDAAAIVLTGFMLGLAGGGWLGGGLAERGSKPLRIYALLELALGLYALAAPSFMASLSHLPSGLLGVAGLGGAARYLACLTAVTLPCLLMGATLPLLVRALTRPGAALRRYVGVAYGANTLGAAAGSVAAAFWAIPTLGVWSCSAVAAGGSALAAALALVAGRAAPARRSLVDADAPVPGLADHARPRRRARLALAVAFLSGAAMLACEMLWARVLTFVFGHDTYAFASLLAIVLVALALGGLLHRLLVAVDQGRLLSWLLGLFALASSASFWVAARLVVDGGRDPFSVAAWGKLTSSPWLELYRELSYTPVLVFVPALLAGITFPAACSLYGEGAADAGRRVGAVLLANGLGSAAGALLAAFGLVVLAGIQGAFLLVALVTALGAGLCWTALVPRGRRRLWSLLPVAAVTSVVLLMPPRLPRAMLLSVVGARHQTLLHYEEARTATISVIRSEIHGERQLLINSVNEVTTRLVHDQSFKLLGHLGALLHPRPRSALMICLGAGISAGAAASHPLERLDVVDLSEAVARGARHFAGENNNVLDNPLMRLHIADGRHFLLDSPGGYDLAIVDSTHPKAVDSWILYTQEFYQLVHRRLAPDGIAVQWLPLHGLSEREFKIIVRTFVSAFEHTTLWATAGVETYGLVAYAKLVGHKGGPLVLDLERLQRRLASPALAADLQPWAMASVEAIVDQFVARAPALGAWTEGLPIQTDDHPLVPYKTRFSRGRPMQPGLLLGVRQPLTELLVGAVVPSAERLASLQPAHDAQGLVLAGLLDAAAARWPDGRKVLLYQQQAATSAPYYLALADRYADAPDVLFDAGTQLGKLGLRNQALAVLTRAASLAPGDVRIESNLALVEMHAGEPQQAVQRLVQLHRAHPRSAVVNHNLGVATRAAGDTGVARLHLEQALALDPESEPIRLTLAQIYLELGEQRRAEETLLGLRTDNPFNAAVHDLLGLLSVRRGDLAAALEHHRAAVALQPYQLSYLHNLGLAARAAGDLEAAQQALSQALAVAPNHAPSLSELGLLEASRERFDRAAELHLRALDAEPDYAPAAHNLGLALHGAGNREAAIGAFCLALRIDGQLEVARQQLGELDAGERDCR